MSGPCSKTHNYRKPVHTREVDGVVTEVAIKPNRKSAKRLAARQATISKTGDYPTGLKTSFFRKPGSQNRNKK